MPETKGNGSLQLDQDLDFERRQWRVERVGWALMLAVLVAAVLGFFGHGLFSEGAVSSPDGTLTIEYPRFARLASPMMLHIRLRPDSGGSESTRLWLDNAYLARARLDRITPEPDSVEAQADGVSFRFKAQPPDAPVRVFLYVEVDRPGLLEGRCGATPEQTLTFRHLVYP